MLVLVRDVELYAPEPRGRCDVLVAAGRIAAIAPAGALPAPPSAYGAEIVDGGGLRAIPGLIDAHVHVTGGGGESGFASRVPPIALGALALAGITSVVGVLGTDTTTRTIEDLVARTLGLREEGVSAWCYTGGYQTPPRTLTGRVRDDLCFIEPIIGVGELAISDHRSGQPTLDELLRIAADCHVAGLHTGKAGFVHLHVGDGPRGLDLVRRALETAELPARVFQPTHVNRSRRLLDESIALAVARGVPLDVTAFPPGDGDGDGPDDDVPAPIAIATALATPGFPVGRLTASSDGCGCLPTFDADGHLAHMDVGRPASLLAALADTAAALGLAAALPVFTSNVADQLRLPRKGRLGVDRDADLVLLDARGGVRDVMARGRWLVRGGAQVVRGTFEPEARGETPS